MASKSFGDSCKTRFMDLTQARLDLAGIPATHRRRAELLLDIDNLLDQYNAWKKKGAPPYREVPR